MAQIVVKIVRNNTAGLLSFNGQDILAGESISLPQSEWDIWSSDDEVILAITNSELIVNDGTQDLTAAQGLYLIENINSVVGKYSHEALSVSTTTSTTFQGKTEMVVNDVSNGDWVMFYSYAWNRDAANSDIEIQILQNDNTGSPLMFHVQEPKDSGGSFSTTGTEQRYFNSGFIFLDGLSGDHTFQVRWRSEINGEEASIWDVRMMLVKVGQ